MNAEVPPQSDHERDAEALRDALSTARTIRSDELFGSDKELLILHGTEIYRLRRTRNGKLILCK